MTKKSNTKDLLVIKNETADLVLKKVQHFQAQKELDLPPNYSAANALKSAWLILQETLDKDKRPALSVCTKASIANALLDMIIQALNPSKDQCYFIVRGNKLCMDRSYFGNKAVALRVAPELDDICEQLIYQGDELEFKIIRGKKTVERHIQKFSNISDDKIVGAYAEAVGKDGEVKRCEIMTIDQIKQAWKQSQMKPVNDDGTLKASSTHAKFTGEMCKRTVINRVSKHIINSSSDSDLVIESARRTDEQAVELEAEVEIEEFANSEVIDIDPGNTEDAQDAPEPEESSEPSPEEQQEIHEREMAEAGLSEDAETQAAGPAF